MDLLNEDKRLGKRFDNTDRLKEREKVWFCLSAGNLVVEWKGVFL